LQLNKHLTFSVRSWFCDGIF